MGGGAAIETTEGIWVRNVPSEPVVLVTVRPRLMELTMARPEVATYRLSAASQAMSRPGAVVANLVNWPRRVRSGIPSTSRTIVTTLFSLFIVASHRPSRETEQETVVFKISVAEPSAALAVFEFQTLGSF